MIFGAGASFDSSADFPPTLGTTQYDVHSEECRLPLGDDLFDLRFSDILARYPYAGAVATRLRVRSGRSVEQVLQQFQEEAEGDPGRGRQLMSIRYYLQETIAHCEGLWRAHTKNVDNYRSLLEEIRACQRRDVFEGALFVSFNYDTLLDEAMSVIDVPIQSIDEYVQHPHYKLVKLHGSVDWARPVADIDLRSQDREDVVRQLIQGRHGGIVPRYLKVSLRSPERTLPHLFNDRGTKIAVVPAIAIPLESKQDFECPPDHLATLGELLPSVTRILVIGWRATDLPFLDFMKERWPGKRPILFVAEKHEAAAAVEGQFSRHDLKREGTLYGGGFSGLIRERGRLMSFLRGEDYRPIG